MTRDELERWAKSKDWWKRGNAALDPHCPPEILSKLAGDEEESVREVVARHPDTPPEALAMLSRDSDYRILLLVAEHSNTKPETLERLSGHRYWLVREKVAGNPICSPEILRYLAHDSEKDVRTAARAQLEQRGLDWNLEGEARLEVLRWLAEHEDEGNHYQAAEAPDCPPELLAKLSTYDKWLVRETVAKHPAAPLKTLQYLANDGNLDVKTTARVQLKLRGLDWSLEGEARLEVLRWLAGHEADENRRQAARAKDCPPDLLVELSTDGSRFIRKEVARNPNTPPEPLSKLAGDEDWDVRRAVAAHSNTPMEVLASMACSRKSDSMIRVALAANPSTPDEALKRLSRSQVEEVRKAARKQLERRQREAACAEYEVGLEAGGMGYGAGL